MKLEEKIGLTIVVLLFTPIIIACIIAAWGLLYTVVTGTF